MALKRSREGVQALESPTKKAKLQGRPLKMNAFKPSTMAPLFVHDEVRQAIRSHLAGDDTVYDQIKASFQPQESLEEGQREVAGVRYLQALLDNVALLQTSCSDLVHAVLHSDWALRGDDYVNLHMRFIVNLFSVKGAFLLDALRTLADHLTWGE